MESDLDAPGSDSGSAHLSGTLQAAETKDFQIPSSVLARRSVIATSGRQLWKRRGPDQMLFRQTGVPGSGLSRDAVLSSSECREYPRFCI